METANKNINPKSPLLKKLIDGLESGSQYQHLRIILSSNDKRTSGQKFLMVSPSAFGIVKLLDFNVENNHVFFVLQDILTGITEKVSIDIDDDTFRFLLISFDDIITLTNQIKDAEGPEKSFIDFDY